MGNYKKIDKDDILYIKNTIQDDERVLVGKNINEEYSHDELSGTSSYPDVVVKAKSAEEIAAIMKYAYENTIPVTPHLLYPQFMDDENPKERADAMHFNYVLLGKCNELWVFGDVISKGMAHEIGIAKKRQQTIRWFDRNCKEVTHD